MNQEHYERVTAALTECDTIWRSSKATYVPPSERKPDWSGLLVQLGLIQHVSKHCPGLWQKHLQGISHLDLSEAELPGALFIMMNRVTLQRVLHKDLRKSKLDNSVWLYCSISNSNFSAASMRYCTLTCLDWDGAVFDGADLSGSKISTNSPYGGESGVADLRNANLSDAEIDFHSKDMFLTAAGANLARCKLSATSDDGNKALDAFVVGLSPEQRDQASIKRYGGLLKAQTKQYCFIATAACASPSAPDVLLLQQYRDVRLLSYPFGKRLIRVYERLSPPVAEWIYERPTMRRLVRHLIVSPLAYWARRSLGSRKARDCDDR